MRSGILVVTVRRRNLTYYEVNPINRGLFSNSNIIILGFVVWWRIAVSVCLITSVTGLFTDPLQNMAAADDSRYYNGKSLQRPLTHTVTFRRVFPIVSPVDGFSSEREVFSSGRIFEGKLCKADKAPMDVK